MAGTTGLYNSGANAAMHHQKAHQAKGADATAQLASGKSANKASVKPSDQALAAQMESLNRVIDQAGINAKNLSSVIQLGTQVISSMRNTLSTMAALAIQAQAAEVDQQGRDQIHAIMDKMREGLQTAAANTEFAGKKLFTGGPGAVTLPANGTTVSEAGTSVAVTNAFDASINAASKGYFNGTASNATVTSNDGSDTSFNYSVKVGDQTFTAENITPSNAGTLVLTNGANAIVLDFAAAVTGTNTLALASSAFTSAMGLDPAGTPATFTSASADPAVQLIASASASTTAAAGEYSVKADTSGLFTLTDSSGRTETAQAVDGAQTLTFAGMGVSIVTAGGYATAVDVDQIQFNVGQGTSVSLTAVTGADSSITTTATFAGLQMNQIGSADLKLDAISLKSAADAALAFTAINAAMDDMSVVYGNLGAAMANLDITQEILDATTGALKEAISGIADADIPEAITQQKIAEVMSELANIAQGKALQQSQQLLKLAQQA